MKTKIIFSILITILFIGCSNNDNNVPFDMNAPLIGDNVSEHFWVHIVDKDGNDLIDPNNPNGIGQVRVKTIDKKGNPVRYESNLQDDTRITYYPVPEMSGLKAWHFWVNAAEHDYYAKLIIDWGNGYGEDVFEVYVKTGRNNTIYKICVNGVIMFEHGKNGQSTDHRYVCLVK